MHLNFNLSWNHKFQPSSIVAPLLLSITIKVVLNNILIILHLSFSYYLINNTILKPL